MPILFSVVACERNVVSHFASCEGNFMEIAEQVLTKIPQCNNKMTYSHGIYLLHYIAEDSYVYFCITDKLCQRSRTFLFLNEIQRRFIATTDDKSDFTEVLAAEMYRYSEDYSTITIRKGELDELNKIGVGFSEDLLGEKILFINNPENISYSTISYLSSTPAHIPYVSSTVDKISHVDDTSEDKSYASCISKPISYIDNTIEHIPQVNGTTELTIHENDTIETIATEENCPGLTDVDLPPEKLSDEDTNSTLGQVSYVATTPEQIPYITNTSEELSVLGDNSEQITVTPRLYFVIIGMALLVIAMAVYVFGPISCAVVTSIGVYSLFRLRVMKEDKTKSD